MARTSRAGTNRSAPYQALVVASPTSRSTAGVQGVPASTERSSRSAMPSSASRLLCSECSAPVSRQYRSVPDGMASPSNGASVDDLGIRPL